MKTQVNITPELVKYCEKTAKKWKRKNKFSAYEDTWDSFENNDINLYVEDNLITVTAYPLEYDNFGDLCPVTDASVVIVVMPWFPKEKKEK